MKSLLDKGIEELVRMRREAARKARNKARYTKRLRRNAKPRVKARYKGSLYHLHMEKVSEHEFRGLMDVAMPVGKEKV